MQLEKKLEKSTEELAKLTRKGSGETPNEHKNIKQDTKENNTNEEPKQEKIVEEVPVYNKDIALAYSVDHDVVSVQTTAHQSVLDIKV